MKLVSTLFALTMVVGACGKSQSSEVSASDAFPESPRRVLAPIKGELKSVAVQAARGPALGIWTNVNLEFLVDCSATFETFSYHIEQTGSKTTIAVSAFVSTAASKSQLTCQAFSHVEKTITLGGVYAESDISVNFLLGSTKAIPANTSALLPIENLFIVSTRPLCPEGMVCITNGTLVTVGTYLGCLDKMGPVTFKGEQTFENGQASELKITLNAINFHNKMSQVTKCIAPNLGTAELQLINMYGDKDSIRLTTLK